MCVSQTVKHTKSGIQGCHKYMRRIDNLLVTYSAPQIHECLLGDDPLPVADGTDKRMGTKGERRDPGLGLRSGVSGESVHLLDLLLSSLLISLLLLLLLVMLEGEVVT